MVGWYSSVLAGTSELFFLTLVLVAGQNLNLCQDAEVEYGASFIRIVHTTSQF